MPVNETASSLTFSIDGYRLIIDAAREAGYTLVPMREAFDTPRAGNDLAPRCRYIRLLARSDMARLEREMGLRSTYFFMTTSEYYNVFNPESRAALREIAGMGHEIGFHWDSNFLPQEKKMHAPFLQAQLLLLGSIVDAEIISASQHIPIDTPGL